MRAYRLLFALAAAYNLAFGLWAGLFPLSFFTLFDLDPPRYPSIWACLGMVVGLYGLVYAYVAWQPERGTALAAIGLVGKVLGPLGWLCAVASGELPPRTFPLIVANDLIWWFPFLFYLLRDVPSRGLIITIAVVVAHLCACLALLLSADGTEIVVDMAERHGWVLGHVSLWTATWLLWAISSLSLIAFVVLWAERLLKFGASRLGVIAGSAIICAGVPCDLLGETMNLAAVRADRNVRPPTADFADAVRLYGYLSPGLANGLYCVGGMILSIVSWQSGWLRGWRGGLGLAMWTVGLLLTLAVIFDWQFGIVATGALVMILFIPWALAVGFCFVRYDGETGQSPAPSP